MTPPDPDPYYWVGAPTPRRSITMENVSILKLAVGILGVGFLGCLGGIIWLAAAEPARAIPDVLVAISTGTLGLIGGILVPNKLDSTPVRRRGEVGAGALYWILVALAGLVVFILLLTLLRR